jgi:hypothetical protein
MGYNARNDEIRDIILQRFASSVRLTWDGLTTAYY